MDSLEIFDYTSLDWISPNVNGKLPCERAGHAMALNLETCSFFLFGGRKGNIMLNDLFCFEIKNLNWTKLKPSGKIPDKRAGHSMGFLRNFLVVYGGTGYQGGFDDVHLLNIDTLEWSLLKILLQNYCRIH